MADQIDFEAAADGLADLLMTIPSIQQVIIGSPAGMYSSSAAWITLGDPGVTNMVLAGGIYESSANLIVWLGYALDDADAENAERVTMQNVAELIRRVARNRSQTVDGVTPNLNGSVTRMDLPHSATSPADYAIMSGQTTRLFPIAVPVYQRENFGG